MGLIILGFSVLIAALIFPVLSDWQMNGLGLKTTEPYVWEWFETISMFAGLILMGAGLYTCSKPPKEKEEKPWIS